MAKSKVKKTGKQAVAPLVSVASPADFLVNLPQRVERSDYSEWFKYSLLPRKMSRCFRGSSRGNFAPTSPDELLHGVKPLSDQIRSYRAGGLSTGTRELGDSNYDEDDSDQIDPSVDPGLDRFERAEALASTISSRMQKKHKEKLEKAQV